MVTSSEAGIGVVARSAAILRTLAETPDGMSLGQIASRIGLPRSTVQRLVAALDIEGLITTGTSAGQISLGAEFLRIAGQARRAVIDRVRPIMETISAELEETVDFSKVQRDNIVFLEQVAGKHRLAAVSHVGDVFPLHCTSVGKSYLASLQPNSLASVLGSSLTRYTSQTIVDFPKLMKELAGVVGDGVAFDMEEHTDGISAVGFAFEDRAANWFGISVPMPTTRFVSKSDQAQKLLKAMASQIKGAIKTG